MSSASCFAMFIASAMTSAGAEPGHAPAAAGGAERAVSSQIAAEVRAALHRDELERALRTAVDELLPNGDSKPFDANAIATRDPLLATLLARAAQATGREDLALPIFEAMYWQAAGAGDGAIAARVAIRVGDVLSAAGHHADAAHWYLKADSEDVLLRAMLGRARALRKAGYATQASIAIEQTAPLDLPRSHPLRSQLLGEAAMCAQAAGRADQRMRYLVEAWTQHAGQALHYPGTSDTDRERPYQGISQENLARAAGPEGVVTRAEGLLRANVLRAAHDLVAGTDFSDPQLRCRAGYVEGKALRNLRRYSSSERALAPVVKACPEQAPKALYLLGRVMAFRKRHTQALGYFDRFAASYPKHDLADDVLFFAGDLLTQQGRHSEAERYYQRVADDYPDGDYHAECLWRLAWGAHLAGEHEVALERLDAIARNSAATPDGRGYQRAVYWRARLSLDDKREAAIDDLDSLVRADPVSYYGAQARAQLHRLVPERARATDAWLRQQAKTITAAAAKAPTAQLPDLPAAQLGHALLEVGLDEEARDVLNTIDFTALDLGPLLAVANDLMLAGDAHAAHWMIRRRAEEELLGFPAPGDIALWRAGFSLGYQSFVSAWAAKRKIDPRLVYALIREESAFDAPVVSWAGAVGLMQLMPFTAREEAAREKIAEPSVADLTEPNLNIRLGTAHITRRIGTFKGNHALAIAAYNAGPGNVNAWLKTTPGPELDTYLESIPVEQTRNYTKRVLRTWVVYRFLYEPDAPWVDLPATVK